MGCVSDVDISSRGVNVNEPRTIVKHGDASDGHDEFSIALDESHDANSYVSIKIVLIVDAIAIEYQ